MAQIVVGVGREAEITVQQRHQGQRDRRGREQQLLGRGVGINPGKYPCSDPQAHRSPRQRKTRRFWGPALGKGPLTRLLLSCRLTLTLLSLTTTCVISRKSQKWAHFSSSRRSAGPLGSASLLLLFLPKYPRWEKLSTLCWGGRRKSISCIPGKRQLSVVNGQTGSTKSPRKSAGARNREKETARGGIWVGFGRKRLFPPAKLPPRAPGATGSRSSRRRGPRG